MCDTVCLKMEGRPYPTPTTPDLPEERVSDGAPFVSTGVDFAGPFICRMNQKVINLRLMCVFLLVQQPELFIWN